MPLAVRILYVLAIVIIAGAVQVRPTALER